MSTLSGARVALTQVIAAGLADVPSKPLVFSVIPERVTPPFVAIGPGDPYVEYEGAVFGGHRVRQFATCVVAPGTNDKQAEALDDLIELVINAIDADVDFVVERVQQPGQVAINNQAHLGASIIVLTEV